jgi:hypothetical protein
VRVGVAGEQGFALDESMTGYGSYEDGAAAELAARTEVVLFTHTQTIDDFRYYADGTMVTSFEPLRGSDRYGTEPDRFVEQMRQVGLPTDVDDDDDVAPVIALLQMLTIVLGIWYRVTSCSARCSPSSARRHRPAPGRRPARRGAGRANLAPRATAARQRRHRRRRRRPNREPAVPDGDRRPAQGVNIAIPVRTAGQGLAVQVPPSE